jgi:hypothetical protein
VTSSGDPLEPAAPGSRTAELLALIDRLEDLLERSSLEELEVSAGDTTLVLRTPGAVAPGLDGRMLAALGAAAGPATAATVRAGGANVAGPAAHDSLDADAPRRPTRGTRCSRR